MTPAAEAAYLAIRHEYARRGRPVPDEPWARILAQAAAEAAGPVITAGERERMAQLAEEREARYDLTKPCSCGRTHPDTGRPCTALIRSGQSFAHLIRGQS